MEHRENKIIMYLGDFGHEINFFLRDAEGAKFAVDDGEDTVAFEHYLDGAASPTSVESNVEVDPDDTGDTSHVRYTIQEGDLDAAGTYWCRFAVNNMRCYPEAMIVVKALCPSGE